MSRCVSGPPVNAQLDKASNAHVIAKIRSSKSETNSNSSNLEMTETCENLRASRLPPSTYPLIRLEHSDFAF